jgi:NAD(P)-dependent dehydrogenase (short-subunit alcohol dehydrogenase family)
MKLEDRVAIIVGGGQTPGETIGNGRATALLFAREGARVLVVDHRLESAEETLALVTDEGGQGSCFAADVTREADCEALVRACRERYGRIDILHNNVGKSEGDAEASALDEASWQAIFDLNLKSMFLTCKHTLPVMREQGSGCIINISSIASLCSFTGLAYKTSKAGINALTQLLAVENGKYGIRVNSILPGLMDTPMAIERRARERNVSREVIRAERDQAVPLRGKMGTGWDVARAALFLASDDAGFVSGVNLPVDGAQSAKVG